MNLKCLRNAAKRFAAEHLPLVLMAYRYAREHRMFFDIPKETPLGFKFVGNGPMQSGVFEPEETKIAERILQKVEIFRECRGKRGLLLLYCASTSEERYCV